MFGIAKANRHLFFKSVEAIYNLLLVRIEKFAKKGKYQLEGTLLLHEIHREVGDGAVADQELIEELKSMFNKDNIGCRLSIDQANIRYRFVLSEGGK